MSEIDHAAQVYAVGRMLLGRDAAPAVAVTDPALAAIVDAAAALGADPRGVADRLAVDDPDARPRIAHAIAYVYDVDDAVDRGRPVSLADALVRAARDRCDATVAAWEAARDAALEARNDLERALALAAEAADVATAAPQREIAW